MSYDRGETTPMLGFMRRVLLDYEDSLRQTGRTTFLANRAKETNSVVVCHSASFAARLRLEYDVEAVTLHTYLNPDYHRGRRKRTYLFDSPAEQELIKRKLEEAEKVMKGEFINGR